MDDLDVPTTPIPLVICCDERHQSILDEYVADPRILPPRP
jgi:hypothetical protein